MDSNTKINVIWEVYEFNSAGTVIQKVHTYDMSSAGDTWGLIKA